MSEWPNKLWHLFREVDDWPLGIAQDCLIEHGCTVLDGWKPWAPGWRANLGARLGDRTVAEIGRVPYYRWVVQIHHGVRLQVSWQQWVAWNANSLDLQWSGVGHTLWARRAWDTYAGTDLVGLVRAWGADYPERYLCDCVVLLWAAVRRVRDGP